MKLFQIQDKDRPMWVIAESYGEAVDRWRTAVALEDDLDEQEIDDPAGVSLVCESFELLLPAQKVPL